MSLKYLIIGFELPVPSGATEAAVRVIQRSDTLHSFVVEPVAIGDNVWVDIDVTVLPGVTIEERRSSKRDQS